MRYQAPRGTEDVLPSNSHQWLHVEREFRALSSRYGYREVRTPTFEETDVFLRTSGETSDIVTKQMYTFEDKGGRSVTLRPELTAPAMRALIEHSLCPPGSVLRMSYCGPIFRYERPQKGRLREAHQFGLELVGSSSPSADAEIIELSIRFYEQLGLAGLVASINSVGKAECRARYHEAILAHMSTWLSDQPEEAQEKARKNPLRLLDSKDKATQEALGGLPPILDFLEDDSRESFDRLQILLTEAGVPFAVDSSIVRGLDYYTGTVFEVQSSHLGSQSSLCGGGRYDNLLANMGGKATPSVGVGMGIERLLIALEATGNLPEAPRPDVFVVVASADAGPAARSLVRQLRSEGLAVLLDIEERSVKSQLRQADGSGARFAAIIGTDELESGAIQLKSLDGHGQEAVLISDVGSKLREMA